MFCRQIILVGASAFLAGAAYAQSGPKTGTGTQTQTQTSTSTSTSKGTNTQQRTGYTRSSDEYSTGNRSQSKQMKDAMKPE